MEKLAVGCYVPTEEFREIVEHTAVYRPDAANPEWGQLVAVTGPYGDAESERDARLFAKAPEMLCALRDVLNAGDIYDWDVQDRIETLLREVDGS